MRALFAVAAEFVIMHKVLLKAVAWVGVLVLNGWLMADSILSSRMVQDALDIVHLYE